MKVRIELTVNVDPVEWVRRRYGAQVKSKNNVMCRKVAEEVRKVCAHAIHQALQEGANQ